MISSLSFRDRELRYADIAALARAHGRDIAAFPYVIRVLLENLCRHRAWGAAVADTEIQALMNWRESAGTDLSLRVARVILPDSSGLPVLQDLAALRDAVARHGGDPSAVDSHIPVDLIVDHSLQVDNWARPDAVARNLHREYERNAERYRFLKWAQQAFRGVRVFPPGTGIIHQVNLEYVADVVASTQREDGPWAYPDFVIGGDSHTPMVNSLGVLGWGVGGIDAEASMLGKAYTFPVPEVVGVRLSGRIQAPALTTDAALLITQLLRKAGVTGCMVEFFGPAVAHLAVAERATIANMAPEYGATCGFFPVDGQTLDYLSLTGRPQERIELVQAYCRANSLYRGADDVQPQYTRVVDIDLSQAMPSMAGPSRPQDRLPVDTIATDFHSRLYRPRAKGGFAADADGAPGSANSGSAGIAQSDAGQLQHGSVVLAAITSCTNTSNPYVMLAAGLLARKAVERGLHSAAWVKTSLAPGSRAVTRYLDEAGLSPALQALGFHTIGYGCTTCGGKSGPLDPAVADEIERRGLVVAAALSGNRNFEGRIHKMIRANYIGSPPMVVAYALAGRIDIDFEREPLGTDAAGQPVYLRELWPATSEIEALLPLAQQRALFQAVYDPDNFDAEMWQTLQAPTGLCFPWDPDSHYLVEPPFFHGTPDGKALARLATDLREARVLAAFGDSLTTDHISPGGEIPAETPAGQYLLDAGIAPRDFNSYVARRCNFEVMTRATFANIRIKNSLLPETEGGYTRHFPDGEQMTIFDAALAYRREGHGTIILAGKEYGTGSSRDWAAKGSQLLGVRAVLAESFERIHRANLVGLGVLPLAFLPGQGWRQLGLTGSETFSFERIEQAVEGDGQVQVRARRDDGTTVDFLAVPQVLTEAERRLMADGGIPQSVLRGFIGEPARAGAHDSSIPDDRDPT
ncbi:aconitate hydratase AcnA [Candidimonas humi]|uniref:Aconitate hydratase n=1 Tax=Candidimonas humi TaxID=683355 RepID=A0ABV8P159_9BURK|nr:aconitate hydratase AcnA [Candidimonas humi]MBV6304042.1 aconitate hydratase AcnA [Candidimonas humi]